MEDAIERFRTAVSLRKKSTIFTLAAQTNRSEDIVKKGIWNILIHLELNL